MEISLLKTGDVLICRGKSVLSGIIKRATHSDWSHTAQVVVIVGEVFIIDAQKDGIGLQNFEFWMNTYNYDFEVYRNPNLVNHDNWLKKSLWYSRVKYDKPGLLVGLFKSLFIKFFPSKNMNDKFRNNGKFWCFEYTMKLIGIFNPEDYDGQDIYYFFKRNNWIKIEI